MSLYKPNKWILVEIKGPDPHHRVFGTWSGGYTSGGSWRMNSGIVKVEKQDEYYHFYGSSGSCYVCHEEAYGSTVYGWGVLKKYEGESEGNFSVLSDIPSDLLERNWL